MKKSLALIIILSLFLSILISCAGENPYFQPLSSLHIPDGVRVVAFGEATHGSHEFKEFANEVFKRLVAENGFRAFAIEAPLGNIMAINEYILYGIGTAREAVRNNGFWVHDFQEVLDLVEWMRNFNLAAEAGDELRFYGYDIQEINTSRERYLAFMRKVDMEKATRDEASYFFRTINTMDIYTMENGLLFNYIEYVDNVINEMKQNEELYVQASSQLEYDFALRNLLGVKWTMEMQTILTETDMSTIGIIPDDFDWDEISETPTDFAESFEFRDKRMYENIKWIVEQEEKRGHGRIFVFGHNGHIMKNLYTGLHPMGVHLAEYYGDGYFAIGTEFYRGKFIAVQTGRGLVEGSLTNDTSELINNFIKSKVKVGVLDMHRHVAANDRMSEILNSEQLMGSVGSMFHPEAPARAYQFLATPAASYDAIIFVRNAAPARFVN